MPFPFRALDEVLDPWFATAGDLERVVAVELFLMEVGERPASMPGSDRVGVRLFSAPVPGAAVTVSWLVADDYLLLVRLRDLRTGEEWGLI